MDGRGATIDALITARAQRAPGTPALLDVEGAPTSFGELAALTGRWRAFLRNRGVGRSDAVAVVLPNGIEMATTFLGVASAAVCAPLNPTFTESEVSFYLEDLSARVVVSDGSSPAAEAAALAAGVAVLRPDDVASAQVVPDHSDVGGPGDVALVLHTSGTTARPKQVPLTHANLCASAANVVVSLGLEPSDRCLNVMPLFHIHGLVAALLASVHAGASVVCSPGFDPVQFATWSEHLGATWYTAVPTIHQAVLAARRGEQAPSVFRFIRSSSASLPPSVLHQLEAAFGCPVVEAYGMTEAAHQMASNPLPPAERKPGTVGTAAGPEVAVMAADGSLLSPGRIGEIVIRGPNVTSGYVGLPEANEAAFGHGWFHTGDQGAFDEDGYLTITGRIKELINRGGEKISPREVDEVLLDHPGVTQAVTFAVPHPTLGEDVAAAVVLTDGSAPSVTELREFAGSRLAPHKVPARVVVLDELPKGATGKLQRIGLAERLGLGDAPPRPTGGVAAVGATSATEAALLAVWSHALGTEAIGLDDDFLGLGGDSLSAVLLVADVAEVFGVELPASAPFDDGATVATMAELVTRARGTAATRALTRPEPELAGAELTHGQEGSWFLDALTGRTFVNNSVLALRLRGPLDRSALAAALDELVARHDALRAVYPAGPDGRPTVIVAPTGSIALTTRDAADVADARRQIEELVQHRIDPRTGPIAVATLLRIADDDHAFALVAHHLTMDDWARGRLRNELAASYGARVSGRASPLTDRPMGAPTFGAQRRRALARGAADESLAYWREAFDPPPEPLELFPGRLRPEVADLAGGVIERSLSGDVRVPLLEAAREGQATLFMVLLTGYVALLHRHTGRTDLAVAVPTAGRRGAAAETVVGQLANALPVRVDTTGARTFAELLERVRAACLGAYAHQDVPFERIVEELRVERSAERRPLVQVAFQLRNLPPVVDSMGEVTIDDLGVHPRTAIDDLAVEVTDAGDRLDFVFEYATSRFDHATAGALADELMTLLAGAARAPETEVGELPLVEPAVRDELLRLGIGPALTEAPALVHERVRAQADATPDAVAVVTPATALTYRDVVDDADRIIARLAAAGIGPGATIAVALPRGPLLPAALLAVLGSGATLVLLDPEHPAARLRTMLDVSGATAVLVSGDLAAAAAGDRVVVDLDVDVASEPRSPVSVTTTASDPAYVVFTSGSTGAPKGVPVTHGAFAAACASFLERVGAHPSDTVLASTAVTFDPSLRELLVPLTVGARIAITPAPLGLDPAAAVRTAEAAGANVVQGTPTALGQLLDAGWDPDGPATIWSCGDRLAGALAAQLLARAGEGGALWNLYGVTESTQVAFAHRVVGASAGAPPPIGTPLPGVVGEVVDEALEPVPFGMDGELLLGGSAVAVGYLDGAGETSFVELPRGRRYRTGDVVRWTGEGELDFVGRGDAQVKLRGVRIELGEVESVLADHGSVTDAVADVRDGRLVAWAALRPGVAVHPEELRSHAAALLPVSMVPATVAVIGAVPRTASGKVDRARLETPLVDPDGPRADGGPPTTEVERMIAGIWNELLRPGRPLRLDDDFFALGGHSLLVVELQVEVDLRFGHELSITQLFETPTLGGLAAAIEALGPPRSTMPDHPETATVVLREGRDDVPAMFLLPGVGGTVIALHRIAPMISSPHRVVGFEAPGHRGGPIEVSVEQFADEYAQALAEVQPTGPLLVAGFSFGGYVAFEMGCRLSAAGRDVHVALLDTGIPGGLPGGEARTRRRRAVRRIERLRDRLLRRPDPRAARPPHLATRVRPNLAAVNDAGRRAAARYRPQRGRSVAGVTIVLSDRSHPDEIAAGWRIVTDSPIDVRTVGGRHGALLWERTSGAAVGAILNELLADISGAAGQTGGGPHGARGAAGRSGTGAPSAAATSSQ